MSVTEIWGCRVLREWPCGRKKGVLGALGVQGFGGLGVWGFRALGVEGFGG